LRFFDATKTSMAPFGWWVSPHGGAVSANSRSSSMQRSSRSGASSTGQRVYLFGAGRADGSADMKALLGGKGANLAEMANLGLPVPPGFTITTEVCTAYNAAGRVLPADLKDEVEAALAEVGRIVGARF